MKRMTAWVKGRVQGVSFRYNTQLQATRMGLTGWIRNEPDGSVYVLAEGLDSVLEEFVKYLSQGPRSARVDSLITNWSEATGEYDAFEIHWL
jgi:acylphosphatase